MIFCEKLKKRCSMMSAYSKHNYYWTVCVCVCIVIIALQRVFFFVGVTLVIMFKGPRRCHHGLPLIVLFALSTRFSRRRINNARVYFKNDKDEANLREGCWLDVLCHNAGCPSVSYQGTKGANKTSIWYPCLFWKSKRPYPPTRTPDPTSSGPEWEHTHAPRSYIEKY